MPYCVVGPHGLGKMYCENLEIIVSYYRIKTSLIEKIIFGLNLREEEEMKYGIGREDGNWDREGRKFEVCLLFFCHAM